MVPQLHERVWPVSEPRGAVVLVHGLGEHSGRYEHVAGALNAAGYSVHAQDVRGHGRSVGFPGDLGGDYQALINDLVAQIGRVRAQHTYTFLYAHSGGTLIALPAATSVEDGTLSGLVLTGIAIAPSEELVMAMSDPSAPAVHPEHVSSDPEVVRAYKEDPLVFYDRVPPDIAGLVIEATTRAVEVIPLVRVPVLLLHGGADRICDPSGTMQAHAELVVSDKTMKVYDGLYHEVHNEPSRDAVLRDIVTWLKGRTPA